MDYKIRYARLEDLSRIERIYSLARQFMAEHGNPTQWGNSYPEQKMLLDDIQKQLLYVMTQRDEIHGVFYFYIGKDPTYTNIYDGTWRSETTYGTIHRIAGDGSGGILRDAVAYCRSLCNHLRIDTHADNYVMQKAIVKQGFSQRGIVYMEDGTPRIAYDLI